MKSFLNDTNLIPAAHKSAVSLDICILRFASTPALRVRRPLKPRA
ncbi:hypothetical protein [Albibacterium bauzanense]|nr:hypothetical protein [Albibacterium bauzanense]